MGSRLDFLSHSQPFQYSRHPHLLTSSRHLHFHLRIIQYHFPYFHKVVFWSCLILLILLWSLVSNHWFGRLLYHIRIFSLHYRLDTALVPLQHCKLGCIWFDPSKPSNHSGMLRRSIWFMQFQPFQTFQNAQKAFQTFYYW